jgi:hypothetical protein
MYCIKFSSAVMLTLKLLPGLSTMRKPPLLDMSVKPERGRVSVLRLPLPETRFPKLIWQDANAKSTGKAHKMLRIC